MNQIDVLSVGDVVTDAFIKLLDDRAEAYETEHGPMLAMPFGMKIPFDHSEVLPGVGNSPNAAGCCACIIVPQIFFKNL